MASNSSSKPKFRLWRWGILTASILAGLLEWRCRVRHPLGSDRSPDGTLRAEYTWSPHDWAGVLIDGDLNPEYHLTVVKIATDEVLLRTEFWGDYAGLKEARDRFKASAEIRFRLQSRPWRA